MEDRNVIGPRILLCCGLCSFVIKLLYFRAEGLGFDPWQDKKDCTLWGRKYWVVILFRRLGIL